MIGKNKIIENCLLATFIIIVTFIINTSFVSAHTFTNYNGITINVDEYLTLLNLGFTEDEIYYMDEATFEANKNLDATLVTKDVRYYKTVYPTYGNSYTVELTEEEYNNQIQSPNLPLNPVVTDYKTMVSTISQNGSKYRYKVSVAWTNMPSTRSFDIIGIGFSDDVYINSSVYFSYTYVNSAGTYTTSSEYYNKKSLSTGGSTVYHLPTSSIVGLSSSLYYDVSKDTTNTITTLSMCGDYAHATSTVNSNNIGNYSIGIGGIGLGSGLAGHYDYMPCAMSYANVSW